MAGQRLEGERKFGFWRTFGHWSVAARMLRAKHEQGGAGLAGMQEKYTGGAEEPAR